MKLSHYEKTVSESKNVSFMQSERWSIVKSAWQSERILLTDKNGNTIGAVQLLIKRFPLLNTSFMYAPRGPVCDLHDAYALSKLTEQIRLCAVKHHAFMVRLDPMIGHDDTKAISLLTGCGCRYRQEKTEDTCIQSLKNYILPIYGRTEQEIFDSFHPKWRYNIRTAVRKGVRCVIDNSAVDDFYSLIQETGKRDGFNIRSKGYYKRLLTAFGDNARLYLCYSPDNTPLSAAIAIRFGDRVSYVYGASTVRQRNLMPNYLMQWNMIQWAISSKCSVYDFMGVPHFEDETHPNYGVYRFKKGFNGKAVQYAGEFDIILSERKYRFIKFLLGRCGYHKF